MGGGKNSKEGPIPSGVNMLNGDLNPGCTVESNVECGIQYSVEDSPPWYISVLLGFQHYISMFVATLTIPYLLGPKICMDEDNVGKSQVIGTLFVASGLITLLQNVIGVRLPIVQAGTFALLAPTLAYFSLPQWECPKNIGTPPPNITTNETWIEVGSPEHREIWMTRLREVQGSLMVAALFEALLGITGAVGGLLRFIGPLSICPTVSLLGLSLFKSAAVYGAHQWWICILTVVLMILFSQYLGWVNIPCCGYNKAQGWHKQSYPVLKMFPVILAMGVAWLTCYILTATDVFPNNKDEWGYGARTDLRTAVITDSPWFRIPYPLQWGIPTVSVSCVIGLMAGLLATTIESVGDYYACAKLAGAPPPPIHAVNRGILVEGLGSMLDGLFGTGNGTTSTSVNVGVIGITKVGSRRVVQISAAFMICLGVFNKFGALFVTVPDPVIGGSFYILFGLIVAVGISNLQYVDLNSSRNLFIIGFAFFVGLSVPEWIKANPGAINTGNTTLDNVLQVLFSTSMFVGGISGFIFDNTIPGSYEERGMAYWRKMREDAFKESCSPEVKSRNWEVYGFPFGKDFFLKNRFFRYIPVCPAYGTRGPLETEQNSILLEAGKSGDNEINVDVTDV